jgi:F-type H+-transporting ATPase subunit b
VLARKLNQVLPIWAAVLCAGTTLAAEPGGESPNLFAGTIGNAVVTLIVFGLVIFILGKFAWPHLMHVLAEREQTIRESLEDARREREQAEELLEKYRQQIEQARVEATEIVDAGRRNAEDVARRVQEEGRREAAEMVERAQREIQLAADAAKKDIYDLSAELAVDVARRIIRKELSSEDHEDLVAESLERMRERDAKLN